MFKAVVALAVDPVGLLAVYVLATLFVGMVLIGTISYARFVWKALREPPARTDTGSVPSDLLSLANAFRARGFSDPQAVIQGTEAEPVVTLVMTDPTGRFDLRFKGLSSTDPPARAASAVSWFSQAQLITSNTAAGGLLDEVVQTCFDSTLDDIVECHRRTLQALHAVEIEPSQVRSSDAAQRYLDEWEREAGALREGWHVRAHMVMLLWRAAARFPRLRAPVEVPDDIVRLGALLGDSPRPER